MGSARNSPPPQARRTARLTLPIVVAVVVVGLAWMGLRGSAGTSLQGGETVLEAEDMKPGDGVLHIDDSGASGGRAARFGPNGRISARRVIGGVRFVVIRARGDQCKGAPIVTVNVDGRKLLSKAIPATDWTAYPVKANVDAGAHTIEVAYGNNYKDDDCDRNLFVDKVTFTNSPTGRPANRPGGAATTGPSAPDRRAPAPSGGVTGSRPLWRGDFETGDLSQWDTRQRVADNRIRVVDWPVDQGRRAARFEVRAGDSIGDTAPRAELALLDRRDVCCREGDERWYRWSTWFAPDFPTDPDQFIDFVQFKKDGGGGGPVTFMVWGEQMELRVGGTHWTAPLERGRWHNFVFHAKWSPDPSVGFIELWYDGRLVLPRTHVPTLDRDEDGHVLEAYLKQGLYRSYDFKRAGVLYHDGMVVGATREAVVVDG